MFAFLCPRCFICILILILSVSIQSIVENCHCSSNGRCNAAGLCLCNPGWSGPICDIKWMNCTNCTNGFCNETLGYCVCDRGFTGMLSWLFIYLFVLLPDTHMYVCL